MIESLITFVNDILSKIVIDCKVPADKQMHFYSGLIISASLIAFVGLYSMIVVAIVALSKEIYDDLNPPHQCDIFDWFATTLGGVIPNLVYLMI